MASFIQDVRGGLRGLLKSPVHSLVAALTIALGIGVNTTMFSIVDAVLLRPLPYQEADRLVAINADFPGLSLTNVGFSVPEMDELSARTDIFEIVTTNTVPQGAHYGLPNLEVRSIAPLFADAISRIHRGASVSSLLSDVVTHG